MTKYHNEQLSPQQEEWENNNKEENKMMNKLDIVRLQLQYKAEQVERRKLDVQRYTENIQQDINNGHYNGAAQWAEKVARAGYELDVAVKELNDFYAMIAQLEEGE